MSVQNLVENALKHNIISKKKPLHITLETSGEELVVTNNLQKKITEEQGTGTGLRNIDNRYRLTFGRRITVEETEQTFGVRIPLVNI
jgi:LytS/YehU family sensor histidine kinase